jgi:protein-tyrosine kinase
MSAHLVAPTIQDNSTAWRPAEGLSEAVRPLLARLCGADDNDPPLRAIGLLGCAGQEGVSTVAGALAAEAAATLRAPVLLVDGHFARPATQFELGLAEALRDGTPLAELIRPTSVPGLSLLAAGTADDLSAAGSAGWAGLVEALKDEFALVVWDLPPADAAGPAADVAARLDGLVLVVEAERTPLETVRRAAVALQSRGHLLGVVLNKRPTHTPDWLNRFL